MSKKSIKEFTPPTVEGQGAQVIRIIVNNHLCSLMLDHAFIKLPAEFPDHPYRRFETVYYLLKVSFFFLNLELAKGFQVIQNLKIYKFASQIQAIESSYQEIKKILYGVLVSVIPGEILGVKGPIYTRTPAFFFRCKIR